MPSQTNDITPEFPGDPLPDYRGFSLQNVCWGYRDIFREAIDELYRRGHLGGERRAVTDKFFELLRMSDRSGMDHVVKRFLDALKHGPRWLLELPPVFADVVDLGRELAEERLSYGVSYFGGLADGRFGGSPRQVHELVRHMRGLRHHCGTDLALALMEGYTYLLSRLSLRELERYIESGVEIYRRNASSGCRFMRGMLRTSETYIANITREVRLEDIEPHLSRLTRAFTGRKIEIDHLGQLDSDDLIERGSMVVCGDQWLYMPYRVASHDTRGQNQSYYLVAAMTATAMLCARSFPVAHGHAGYEDARVLFDDQDPAKLNLFVILEYARVFQWMRSRWPGIRVPLNRLLSEEIQERATPGSPEALLAEITLQGQNGKAASSVIACRQLLSKQIESFADLTPKIDGRLATAAAADFPGLQTRRIRPLSFVPDFLFPLSISQLPPDKALIDLRDNEKLQPPLDQSESDEPDETATDQLKAAQSEGAADNDESDENEVVEAGYVYDEWNQGDADYLHDYCVVKEENISDARQADVPEDIFQEARRVSRTFERIKPEETSREKYLAEGDVINEDLLLNYLVERQRWPSPRVNFYEKPRTARRDLAVMILLDCSGSTGESREEKRTIDLETHATVVLGEALSTLDDRFAACGFNSNGPRSVHFYMFKDFAQPWNRTTARVLRGVQPAHSTRIGAAIRHAGWRLEQQPNKQKLIILITDGRPQDQAYDPNNLYAQHDVRMACQENERLGVHTFAISTTENSATDMQLMFGKRYVLLQHIKRLPELLPRLYSRLTF